MFEIIRNGALLPDVPLRSIGTSNFAKAARVVLIHSKKVGIWYLNFVIYRFGALAQLARVLAWQARSHGFESRRLHESHFMNDDSRAKLAKVPRA